MHYLKKSILVIAIFTFILGCNKCKDIACFSPPIPINLELLDATTKENIYLSGTYSPDEIIIIDNPTGSEMNFSFDSINNIIELGAIAWDFDKETFNYKISVLDVSFDLYISAERVTEDCCNFTRIIEQSISNYESENSSSSETIVIYIN